ncbi:MAG: T9SS type A sorting domain-containing protein [Rickettsiaceae bacterium]|nr:T9SS type A sorting domain-containing protein [Rickettsiaceae bacterium]
MFLRTIILLCVIFLYGNLNAQIVYVDTTFGNNGRVITTINPIGHWGYVPSVLQNDGKIVVASNFAIHPILVRYLPNGDIDSTWGQNGFVETVNLNFESTVQIGSLIEVENDKILMMGYSDPSGLGPVTFLIKYNSNGSLDTTFGNNGIVYHYENNTIDNTLLVFVPFSMVVSNNVIYVSGYPFSFSLPVNSNAAIVAFNLNSGSRIQSFGNLGRKIYDHPNPNNNLQGFHAVIYKYSGNRFFMTIKNVVYRLMSYTLEIDSTFGNSGSGYVELNCLSEGIDGWFEDEAALILKETNSGKLIVGGIYNRTDTANCFNTQRGFMIGRLLQNGSVDSSFGNNGFTFFNFSTTSSDFSYLADIKILSNNYLLVAGNTSDTFSLPSSFPNGKLKMLLFDDSGNLVPSFGNNGIYTESNFHLIDSLDGLTSIHITDENKVILVSRTPHFNIWPSTLNSPTPTGNLSINLSQYIISRMPEQANDTIYVTDTIYINDTTYIIDTTYVNNNDTTVIYDTVVVYDTINNIKNAIENNIKIYPNPTDKYLHINSDIPLQKAIVYDYLGKAILYKEQELNKINVMDLQSGAYILTLTTKKGITYYYRFVKE